MHATNPLEIGVLTSSFFRRGRDSETGPPRISKFCVEG